MLKLHVLMYRNNQHQLFFRVHVCRFISHFWPMMLRSAHVTAVLLVLDLNAQCQILNAVNLLAFGKGLLQLALTLETNE